MILKNFNIKLNPNSILKKMDCSKDNPMHDYLLNLFYSIEKNFYCLINPKALFKIKNGLIDNFDSSILVLYTVGKEINDYLSYLFEKDEYTKGLLVNSMADEYLMSMEQKICLEIINKCRFLNLGCKKRFIPGENISIEWQEIICNETKSLELIQVMSNNSFVLQPSKSLSFIIAANKNSSMEDISHNCNNCGLKNCKWRNTYD